MSRSGRRTAPAVVLVVILAASTSFRAQSASTHTLTFAELSYGNSITGLARDASGAVWFAGQTCSATLPTTVGAFQRSAPPSACNGMFGRMTADGAVTYLSYLGGSHESRANAIALDSSGNVYVAGYTFATDFPTTAGAYDRTCGTDGTCMFNKLIAGHPVMTATRDGFLTKLTPAADRLIYSTYIGGQDDDAVSVMAVDTIGRVYLGGKTISGDFPVTAGAIQSSFSFGAGPDETYFDDAFYARVSADGSSLEYSTYLGGAGEDSANAIALGAGGDAFVVGMTASPDFPTVNPVQPTFGDPVTSPSTGSDAFVARFSSAGPAYSTFMGGSSSDGGAGVAVVDNSLYVAGSTCSPNFPGGVSSGTSCHTFLSELAASNAAVNRTMLLQGTNGFDKGTALAVDANHVAYVGGSFSGLDSVSGSFPTTPDAYQRSYAAGWDAFLSIVDMSAEPSLVYSTLLGGGKDESIAAVLLDGSGGAFFAGSSGLDNGARASGPAPFPSHTTNAEPPSEGVSQSFVAHVGVAQGTTGGSPNDVVLYARDATTVAGNWQFVADSSAAGGARLWNPDGGVPKILAASASPSTYFELTFNAQAGQPYHLWLRLKADGDSYQNDSVWVQFSDSVDANGSPIWRTGTTTGTWISLEDCSGCGEQGWGWNDNGYRTAATPVYFAASGAHTIRIQQREDGVSIDQIVLSSATWANTAPGANKNDTTIVPEGGGTGTSGGHLPAGWMDADVGATGAVGSATYSNDLTGTYTLKGAGADVWGTDDAFHYAWTGLSGDGTIVARVESVSDEASWVKAGVMIRTNLDPSSAQAFLLVSHAKGVCFQRRVSDGASTVSTCGSLSTAPHWVRLTRTGNAITGFESVDGANWTVVGSDTFAMPNDVDAGLAVSSHLSGMLSTATFDRVVTSETSSGGQCASLTLSQTSFYSGGPASNWQISVTAQNDTCTWVASVDQSWLALNGVTGPTTVAGTGSGKLTLQTVDNRTGATRAGTFRIGGTTYKVTQESY